jgi:hypothetical protein
VTWTYSGDPGSSPLDQTRFWLQDTEQAFPLMQNEELQWLLDTYDNQTQGAEMYCASIAADVLANRFAKEVDTSADGVSVALGQLQERYQNLATNLREQWKTLLSTMGSADFAGIMLDVTLEDPTIQPLVFGVGFMDNYAAGQQDFGYYSPGDYEWMLGAMTGDATYP